MKRAPRQSGAGRHKTNLLLEAAGKRMAAVFEQGRFEEALQLCQQALRIAPNLTPALVDAAASCVRLERWREAIDYGQRALAAGGNTLALYDALSHAYGHLGDMEAVRKYGRIALDMRDRMFGSKQPAGFTPTQPLPPVPEAATRQRNLIAFSLFGGSSKYCETAVLNVEEQPRIYPYWTCRFYVDDSVPAQVLRRIEAGGAQVVHVQGELARWPGTLWRFLALDDAQMHRVIFRDADSVISEREAQAVAQWVESGKRFHVIRDYASHTELLLAGLWGAVCGSLPPLQPMAAGFLARPVKSRHFADQYFLRECVWPHARQSLMQHDSLFGFLDSSPLPGGPPPARFHVGCSESAPFFSASTSLPEASPAQWSLYLLEGEDRREALVCTYPAVVRNGLVTAHLPDRFAKRLSEGTARVKVEALPSA